MGEAPRPDGYTYRPSLHVEHIERILDDRTVRIPDGTCVVDYDPNTGLVTVEGLASRTVGTIRASVFENDLKRLTRMVNELIAAEHDSRDN